jgi:hypothetical protein
MKYITIKDSFRNHPGGRTGHRLKDIMSLYIISFFVKDLQVLPDPSWNVKQHLIKFHCEEINTNSLTNVSIQKVNTKHEMGYNEFTDLVNYIKNHEDDTIFYMDIRVVISPFNLTNWYNAGLISSDIYNEKFITLFKKLYNGKQVKLKNQLAFHVRRGDIYNPNTSFYNKPWCANMRWGVLYIQKRILDFKKHHPNLPIKIFTEKIRSEDLDCLNKFSKLQIIRGDDKTLRNDIHEMVNSKFFIPCNSGLSTNIAYLCNGTVLLDPNKFIKHFHKKSL